MNPKYLLMVKEEIDKLLECGFIYHVLYSEWVSQRRIGIDLDKILAILKLNIFEHMISLKEFLGATGYYRRFIYFYAQVVVLLTHLIKQTNIPSVWIEECTKAFNKLKK